MAPPIRLSWRAWTIIALGLAVVAAATMTGWLAMSHPVATTSRSMSHSDEDLPGIMDPGERTTYAGIRSPEDVQPWVVARETGHRIGGEWGDVISFRAIAAGERVVLDDGSPLHVGHRAIAWLRYNASKDAYDAPELGAYGLRALEIAGLGYWDAGSQTYRHVTFVVRLDPTTAGRHDGWLTKGDYNEGFDQDAYGGLAGVGPVELVAVEHALGRAIRFADVDETWRLAWIALVGGIVLTGGVLGWRRLGPPKLGMLGRCPACGAAWSDAAFCARCGRERS